MVKQEITFGGQFSALFRKNLVLQKHQFGTTICQILVPMVLIIIIGIFQIIVDNQVTNLSALQPPDNFRRLNISKTVPKLDPKKEGVSGIPYFRWTVNDETDSPLKERVGSLDPDGSGRGFLSTVDQSNPFLFGAFGKFPHFISVDSKAELDKELIEIYEYWKVLLHDDFGFGPKKEGGSDIFSVKAATNGPLDDAREKVLQWLQDRNYTLLPPFGAFIFNQLNDQTLDVTVMPGSRYGGWGPDGRSNVSLLQILYPEVDRQGNMINIMSNAFSKQYFGADGPKIAAAYQGFSQKVLNSFDLSSILGVYLLGFAVSFLLPTFISNIVIDRHEKILIMMEMSGLRMPIYWLVTLIYNMLTFYLVMAAMWITGALFGMKIFVATNFWLLFFMFTLWALSLNALAYFFASFFSKPRTASISAYFIVIFGVIISNLLNATVYLSDLPPWWYFIYPPFAFYRALFIMEDACIRLQCLTFDRVEGISYIVDQFTIVSIMLVCMSLIFVLLGFCVNNYMNIYNKIKKMVFQRRNYSMGDHFEPLLAEASNHVSESSTVHVQSLSFEYPNGHKALRKIDFNLQKGECFGLLGANGAGKTTLISCLTGQLKPTSGTAIFSHGDLDLRVDLVQIQSRIGVCMQFDVFYPRLTVWEHLGFYGRLKGISERNLDAHLREIIKAVDLQDSCDVQAQNLSGGMRRRLSMAIALLGRPELIILDEPSTGLDPGTRRQVWRLFTEICRKRQAEEDPVTVILTTHSMDEAEELCDRLGIMSQGELICVGTSSQLKQQYSCGYRLYLQLEKALIVHHSPTTIRDLLSDVELLEFLPQESIKHLLVYRAEFSHSFESLKQILVKLMALKLEQKQIFVPETGEFVTIKEWGLNQTTLEDVFLKIIYNRLKQ